MTDENTTTIVTQEQSQKAFDAEQSVVSIKSQINGSYLELGRRLKEVKDNKYYAILGYTTMNEWLSDPKITIASGWAYHAISMYEIYVLQLGKTPEQLQDIDYTKLYNILPMIKEHPEKADEWIDKAASLRRIDLQSEIKTQKISDRVDKIETLRTIEPVQGILHGDPVAEVKQLADGTVDAVITAPDPAIPAYVLQELLSEFRRVVKPNGSILLFCDYHNLVDISVALNMNDYRLVRDIVLSYGTSKRAIGVNTLTPYHETVLWASRDEQPTYNLTEIERDVWAYPSLPDEPQHPMEKPMETILSLIEMVTDEGQTILDPFAGSGNIVVAAKTLNRNFIAIEQDELWYKLTLEKIHTK